MIYIPVNPSCVLTQTLESRKPLIINDATKDRVKVNEIRSVLRMSEKLRNLMIVPLGENKGKHGGAMLIIFLNKFTMDGDKMIFDKFDPSTVPACNKVFQLVLVETLSMVAFRKRLEDEVIIENLVFKTMDKIM